MAHTNIIPLKDDKFVIEADNTLDNLIKIIKKFYTLNTVYEMIATDKAIVITDKSL